MRRRTTGIRLEDKIHQIPSGLETRILREKETALMDSRRDIQARIATLEKERAQLDATLAAASMRHKTVITLLAENRLALEKLTVEEHRADLGFLLDAKHRDSLWVQDALRAYLAGRDVIALVGYWADTDQPMLSITMQHDGPIDKVLDVIYEAVPHYRTHKDDCVWFDILDHHDGFRHLGVAPDLSMAKIVDQTTGEVILANVSVTDALRYISLHLWDAVNQE